MTDLNRLNSSNLDAVKSDGTATLANRDGAASTFGVTFSSGTTYYFPLGSQRSPVPAETPLVAAHLRWDSSIIATITIEDSCFPRTTSPANDNGPTDVSDFDATAGNWLQENPSSAVVAVTGGTATGATVSVAGGSAGGCVFHLGNLGSRRVRIKVVVAGTGGKIRCAVHGKAAA